MFSTQKIKDTNVAPSSAGVPGTAANLPRPESTPAKTKLASSRQSESVTYQTSRTVKHTRIPQGAVKRLSVSVLVDQGVRWEKQQQVLVPPTPEKMKMIHDLVAGVIGFNAARGDQLTVE